MLTLSTAKIMGLKKTATKGDKKKKKEVAEEIAKLEHELEERHQNELQQFEVLSPYVRQDIRSQYYLIGLVYAGSGRNSKGG